MRTGRLGLTLLSMATAGAMLLPGSLSAQNKNVLKRDELLASAQKSKDLYEAIRSLRPNFLNPLTTRTQGNSQRPKPAVYLDGALAGDLEALHGIMVENVELVEFKSPSEAYADNMGPAAAGGAILVTRHKEPKP